MDKRACYLFGSPRIQPRSRSAIATPPQLPRRTDSQRELLKQFASQLIRVRMSTMTQPALDAGIDMVKLNIPLAVTSLKSLQLAFHPLDA